MVRFLKKKPVKQLSKDYLAANNALNSGNILNVREYGEKDVAQ